MISKTIGYNGVHYFQTHPYGYIFRTWPYIIQVCSVSMFMSVNIFPFLTDKVKMTCPIPSGKLTVCYRKSQCLMGKLTISMAIFNRYVSHYQRVSEKSTSRCIFGSPYDPNIKESFGLKLCSPKHVKKTTVLGKCYCSKLQVYESWLNITLW